MYEGKVLSNIIGAPFDKYILDQLNVRSKKNALETRTNEDVLYLANKMSWTRLVSSIRIAPAGNQTFQQFYANLFDGETVPGDYTKPESLAQNWILQAGTSQLVDKQTNLRFGLGPNGAYGLGGLQQGYRPMPGIESLTIDSKGTLGSLREASINFKVWNIVQLNIVEALYFRLGYTMLLEWGHVNYFDNKEKFQTNSANNAPLDIFDKTQFNGKEDIQQAITKKNKQSNGNYDGMLGTVTNFYYSFNQDGGFDCNIKLVGLGSVIDTVRINQTYTMPKVLETKIRVQQAKIDEIARIAAENQKKADDLAARIVEKLPGIPPPKVTDINGIKKIYDYAQGVAGAGTDTWLASIGYPSIQYATANTESGIDYYYKAAGPSAPINSELNRGSTINNVTTEPRTGLFLAPNQKTRTTLQVIPANISITNPQPVTLNVADMVFLSQEDRQGWAPDILSLTTGNALQLEINNAKVNSKPLNLNSPLKITTVSTDIKGLTSRLSGLFDTALYNSSIQTFFGIKPNETVNTKFTLYVPYVINYKGTLVQKYYLFQFNNPGFFTREDLIKAFDTWTQTSRKVDITDISVDTIGPSFPNQIILQGTLADINIVGKASLEVKVDFITNDTGLIDQVLPRLPAVGAPAPVIGTSIDSTGNTVGAQNGVTVAQTKEAKQYNSALHAMLIANMTQGQATAYNTLGVTPIDFQANTKLLFDSGVLNGIFNVTPKQSSPASFNVLDYAIKGFTSDLMADKTLYNDVPNIDLKALCTGYIANYNFSPGETTSIGDGQKPVYIKFGYLLAFMNSMCLLYEANSTQSTTTNSNDIKPYFYIDFHPEYNFCLTSPKHFTVDPYKVLIPFQATLEDYKSLFPPDIAEKLKNELFNPGTNNVFSNKLPFFKANTPFQGKTMEILLNTQYLLEVADQFLKADADGAVYFKPFLDRVLDDINKATGGFNLFRVAYRDDSNTVIIKDDQRVPSQGEPTCVYRAGISANPSELNIFGKGSIIRDMEFRTNMNTPMSAMIAISAQAAIGKQVANAQDATAIGAYNTGYDDAFMKIKLNSTSNANNGSSNLGTPPPKKTEATNDLEAARKFNAYVDQVYNAGGPSKLDIDHSVSYYLNRLRISKAEDIPTQSAPFIPANLSINIDGISGILMGNAFTIPSNRLPASLRGTALEPKVGFVVVGLTQTLQNNEWTTRIRGQMIKIGDDISATGSKIAQVQGSTGNGGYRGSTVSTNGQKTCPGLYPGAGSDYSCARQTSTPFDTAAFKRAYPNYVFQKGTSNINLKAAGLTPLTESDIIDDTSKNKFDITNYGNGTITSPAANFVIHHTGGGGTADGTYATFYSRGLPAQYVIDQQGGIHRFLPDGALGWHAGPDYNRSSIGVEVIGANDQDIAARSKTNNKAQLIAAARLAQYLGFKKNQVVGHGPISQGTKEFTEGKTIVDYIKTL
jgi:hypothetical protein